MSRTTKIIAQVLRTANRKKTSAYDTTAQVVRVDGDTVWVHIPGGVEETPVRRTIDAEEGDTVQVRVSGGSAFLVGNRTAPPTDDTTAKEAKDTADDAEDKAGKAWDIADEAMDAADDAWDKADEAEEAANFALRSANGKNTVYYSNSEPEEPEEGFSVGDTWFDTANDCQINEWDGEEWVPFQLGEDAIADLSITNAKIANATIQSAKIAGLDVGKLTGGYINAGHINTLELVVGSDKTLGDTFDEYDGAFEDIDTEMSDMADDIDAVESTANTALSEANQVYPYMTYINSTYGVRVYRGDKSNAENQKYYSQMNAGGFDVVADNVTLAHIGYASGAGESGTATAPYYTLGTRASDTYAEDRGNYSVAEGLDTTASGFASHAEGYGSTASGRGAHAEGEETLASKGHSHAEGYLTIASNHHAHAEGEQTTASGMNSHAQNFYTNAGFNNQTAIGKYNNNISTNAFEIGNGTGSSARSNALAVDWNGVARLKGNLFTGCSSDSTGGYEFGRKTGNHVVVGGIHVCWGQVSLSCSANAYTETTVTLPYTYSSAPYVFTGFAARNANARSTMGTNGGLALNKIYVGCVSTSARDQTVIWMTIGA